MRGYFLLPFVVAVAIMIALVTRVAPIGGRDTGYSLEKAQATLTAIASVPRPVGSTGHSQARDWLVSNLSTLGLNVSIQSGIGVRQANFDARRKGSVSVAPYENIIAVLPGRDRAAKSVVLMAHYDSVLWANGAADNAAGVAGVLETARILTAGRKPARDVIFLLTDAEELGLIGAQEFFDRHPLAANVGIAVNLDARGSRGRAIMFQTSPGNGPLIALWAKNAVHPTGNSLANSVYKLMPNDTDLSVPLARNISGINAAFIDGLKDYHMPTDRLANIDPHSVEHLGNFALTTTQALAFAETLPAPGLEATYFDLFGLLVVRYPMWIGWVLVALGFCVLFTSKIKRLGVRWPQAVIGALGVLGLTIYVGAISHLVPSIAYGYGTLSLRERINEMGPALWLYVALASSSVLLVRPRETMWTGSVILMLVLALVTQIWIPGASWLFVWGGLIGALLLNLATRSGWHSTGVILISAVTGGLWGALLLTGVIVTYDSMGPSSPAPVALIIPFAITLVGPVVMAFCKLRHAQRFASVVFVCSWLGALWLLLDPSFSDRNPMPGDLFYYSDQTNNKNYWATSSTSRQLPSGKTVKLSPAGFDNFKWMAVPAPAAPVASPKITIREEGQSVVVVMASEKAPRLMSFLITPSTSIQAVRVNGKKISLREGEPTRIAWRAEIEGSELRFEFDSNSSGKLSVSYLYAVAGMPSGAPTSGGQDTDWTRLNNSRVAFGKLSLPYGRIPIVE